MEDREKKGRKECWQKNQDQMLVSDFQFNFRRAKYFLVH